MNDIEDLSFEVDTSTGIRSCILIRVQSYTRELEPGCSVFLRVGLVILAHEVPGSLNEGHGRDVNW